MKAGRFPSPGPGRAPDKDTELQVKNAVYFDKRMGSEALQKNPASRVLAARH